MHFFISHVSMVTVAIVGISSVHIPSDTHVYPQDVDKKVKMIF